MRNVFGAKKQPSTFGARKVGSVHFDTFTMEVLQFGPTFPAGNLFKHYLETKTQVRPKIFWSLLNVKRFLTIFLENKPFFRTDSRRHFWLDVSISRSLLCIADLLMRGFCACAPSSRNMGKHSEFIGALRSSQELSGALRSLQEPSGVLRCFQEAAGVLRRPQEFSGVLRRLQELSGAFRRLPELSGGFRSFQEV
jgi:hypothetical protein